MVVLPIRFSPLDVFVVLDHWRRRVLHIAVTDHPTAEWTAQQLTEALPWESHARFIHRDQDGIFGQEFQKCVAALELQEVVSVYLEDGSLIGTMDGDGKGRHRLRTTGFVNPRRIDSEIMLRRSAGGFATYSFPALR